jgi:CO/xanthine dehydrogenase Mo-binding subunit
MPSTERSGGIGEPGTVIVQPAVANAVFAAMGVQLTYSRVIAWPATPGPAPERSSGKHS